MMDSVHWITSGQAHEKQLKSRLVGAAPTALRERDDFYATPPEATAALLGVERFTGDILEPACGDGAISKVLQEAGHAVTSTDLIDRGYGESSIDFLLLGYPYRAANLITNPPFKLALPFIYRALEVTTAKVAMLLRVQMLEGQARRRMWSSTPIARVWVFASRVSCLRNGKDKGEGMMAYAWFVWDRTHSGPPTLGWLPQAAPGRVPPTHPEGLTALGHGVSADGYIRP